MLKEKMYCKYCGKETTKDSGVCLDCAKVIEAYEVENPTSKASNKNNCFAFGLTALLLSGGSLYSTIWITYFMTNSFFMSLYLSVANGLGLTFGILGLTNAKKGDKDKNKIGLVLSIVGTSIAAFGLFIASIILRTAY